MLGKVREKATRHADGFVFGPGEVVGHPALGRVQAAVTELFRCDADAERGADHRRPGREERGVLGHDDQVRKEPGECAVTCGYAEHQRDDGYLALKIGGDLQVVRREGVALEDVCGALAGAV